MATSNYLQCLAALGRYDESVEVVQHVAPRNPPPGVMDDDLADRLLFIGRLMTYLGEFELSIRAFQALIDGSSEGVVSRQGQTVGIKGNNRAPDFGRERGLPGSGEEGPRQWQVALQELEVTHHPLPAFRGSRRGRQSFMVP